MSPFEDPITRHVFEGINGACRERGIHYFVHTAREQHATTAEAYVETLRERAVEGVLFLIAVEPEILARLPLGIAAVACNVSGAPESLSRVHTDYVEVGRLATRHLLERGHTRIACIGGGSGLRTEPFRGYKRALAERDLAYDEFRVSLADEAVPDEHRYAHPRSPDYWFDRRVLAPDRGVTAVFAMGTRHTRAVYACAEENGLRIPADLSVIGMDDVPAAAEQEPPLSVVNALSETMGRTAVKLLSDLIEARVQAPVARYVPPELVIRESCGEAVS
jgi:LacI family transcriptional regulator